MEPQHNAKKLAMLISGLVIVPQVPSVIEAIGEFSDQLAKLPALSAMSAADLFRGVAGKKVTEVCLAVNKVSLFQKFREVYTVRA